MNYKKCVFSAILLFVYSTSFAEVLVKDSSAILGLWNLDGTAFAIDAPKRPGQQTWEFGRNGKLTLVATDSRVKGSSFEVIVKYEVKDGKIIADQAGRPGKTNTYTVTEKSANQMTLKEVTLGYFFLTKQ